MFKGLNRNIQVVLLTVVFFYMLLSSWVVYRTMESRGTESLQRMSVQYTGQQHQNAELFKRWMEETVQVVASREGLREALSGRRFDETLLPQLDGLRASNVDITSLVLYGQNGIVYSSGNVTSVRNLEQLQREPEIDRFIRSGAAGEWMVLDASRIYYSSNGTPRKSLFYFTRIADRDDHVVGVLQLETSLSKLLGFFRSEAGTIYGSNQVSLVSADGQWLEENGRMANVPEEAPDISFDSNGDRVESEIAEGILLTYALEHSSDRIAIIIPDEGMKGELKKLGIILIAVDAAIALLFVWLVRRLSLSLIEPLKSLYHKMRKGAVPKVNNTPL